MRIPKRYGQSRRESCPFCSKQAITHNKQNVPVCQAHSNTDLPLMKCMCGETLDLLHGKYGVFFSCIKHGNMNLRKALEINPIPQQAPSKSPTFKKEDKKERKEITVTSDELDYMF